jgi:hypothetical protein
VEIYLSSLMEKSPSIRATQPKFFYQISSKNSAKLLILSRFRRINSSSVSLSSSTRHLRPPQCACPLHEIPKKHQNLLLHAFFFYRAFLLPDYLLPGCLISGIVFRCLGLAIPRNPKKRVFWLTADNPHKQTLSSNGPFPCSLITRYSLLVLSSIANSPHPRL